MLRIPLSLDSSPNGTPTYQSSPRCPMLSKGTSYVFCVGHRPKRSILCRSHGTSPLHIIIYNNHQTIIIIKENNNNKNYIHIYIYILCMYRKHVNPKPDTLDPLPGLGFPNCAAKTSSPRLGLGLGGAEGAAQTLNPKP